MRISAKSLAGAVAMLAVGASVVLSQDTTRARPTSTRRIPITKEGGEVARKVDTVTVYKTDTLRVNVNTPPTIIHDTVTQTRTVTRVKETPSSPLGRTNLGAKPKLSIAARQPRIRGLVTRIRWTRACTRRSLAVHLACR